MLNIDNETIILVDEGKRSESELEKIFALKALRQNPGILGNAFTFEKLCYVLNDLKPDINTFEPPTILHICKAIQFLEKQYPNFNWHPEIKEYIAQIGLDEGWYLLPSVLNFAQKELDAISYKKEELNEDQKKMQELKHLAVKKYLETGK
jgi:hypothetical protein